MQLCSCLCSQLALKLNLLNLSIELNDELVNIRPVDLIELTYKNWLLGVISPVSSYLFSFSTHIHVHTHTHTTFAMATLNSTVHFKIFKYIIFSSDIQKFANSVSSFLYFQNSFSSFKTQFQCHYLYVWCQFQFAADSNEETFSVYIEINKREISGQRNVIFLRVHLNQPFVVKSFAAFRIQPQWNRFLPTCLATNGKIYSSLR